MIVHSAKSMCFVRSIYMHVSAVFFTKQKSLGWIKHRNEKEHLSSWNPLGEKTCTVFLVRVRKYSRKQVSCTVLWVLWCTGAITHEFLGAQPKIQ